MNLFDLSDQFQVLPVTFPGCAPEDHLWLREFNGTQRRLFSDAVNYLHPEDDDRLNMTVYQAALVVASLCQGELDWCSPPDKQHTLADYQKLHESDAHDALRESVFPPLSDQTFDIEKSRDQVAWFKFSHYTFDNSNLVYDFDKNNPFADLSALSQEVLNAIEHISRNWKTSRLKECADWCEHVNGFEDSSLPDNPEQSRRAREEDIAAKKSAGTQTSESG